jgi:LysR family cyn operon transcriptional activator
MADFDDRLKAEPWSTLCWSEMPMITLQQLQYFLAAVEHGSLSAAAEANFVAQPSLSEQIRRLESQLGVTLFQRTNRKLILTDAALMLLPHAERTIEAAEAAMEAVSPIRTLTGGTVALGTFSSAHHLLHEDVVSDFRALHPLVRVRLVGMNSSEVAQAVREGQLEAGLVALPVDDQGLDVGPVRWVSEAVYLSKDRERTTSPLDAHSMVAHDLILPEVGWGDMDPTRRQLVVRAQNAGVRIEPMVEVESPAAALALAARGVGDTIISLPLAHHLGFTDRLHWASLDPPLFETFAFITRRGAQMSPATTILMRLMAHRLAMLPLSAPLPGD